jgi:hypothetical protein
MSTAVLTVTELDTLSLVPPRRFGRLLQAQRVRSTTTLDQLERLAGGRFDRDELADVEAGRRALPDEDLVALSGLYGVHTEPAVHPRRATLTVDDEPVAGHGDGDRRWHSQGDRALDDVLVRYLGLVVALRGAVPGTTIPIRQLDIGVLAGALSCEPMAIEERLASLMANPRDRVGRRVRRLSRRTVVPEAGILVAVTEGGALVLDGSGESPLPGAAVRPRHTAANVIALARHDSPAPAGFAARTA